MNKKALLKGMLLFIGGMCIQSCDKDFSTVGSDIIGDENFLMDKYVVKELVAYNQVTGEGNEPGAVDAGNLPYNALGAYNDPFFGKTEASFVTQVFLPRFNHLENIGNNPKIESVYIYIPYENNIVREKDEDLYLKKIYGEGKINLQVYENGYFLNSFNPNGGDAPKIYSDELSKIDNLKKGKSLNDSNNPSQNTAFVFDKKERKDKFYKVNNNGDIEKDKDSGEPVFVESKTPAMLVDLNKEHFEKLFFSKENSDKLKNNSAFINFFRGLYFKAEIVEGSEGSMGLLNFGKGKLVIVYNQDSNNGQGREKKVVEFSISSDLTSKIVDPSPTITANFFNNNFGSKYLQGLSSPNKNDGDEKLYLKGGSGSFSVIEPFKKNSAELEQLKKNKWLVNDARLTIYVDKISLADGRQVEPDRIYLYDLDNNRPILDYITDNVAQSGSYSKPLYGGILEKEEANNNKGFRYRIKVADHINSIINSDAKNVKLGLAVSYDINYASNKNLKKESNSINKIPASSIMLPLGTVLYGNNTSEVDKKMKLEIFYTDSKK